MADETNTPSTSFVPPSQPATEALSIPPPAESKTDSVDAMSGALQGPEAAKVPKAEGAAPAVDTNGDVDRPTEAPSANSVEAPAEPASTAEDTEMKDASEDAAPAATSGAAAPEHETSDSPSASRKPANGKRKSTGGVPEHKSKKLNKKKSIAKITHLDAQPGGYYFARLKSYPPWPSIICEEEMLPPSLLTTRPVTTKQVDGAYKEPFADGGKRVHERTFPVMFLHTNEFAWIPNTDLTPLNPDECKDVPEKGKSKSLVQAYGVAAENHDLQYFKEMLQEHQRALQAEIEGREARQAAKAAKAEKRKKRKSTDATNDEDVDMEDAVEDEEPKPKSSKKRKKEEEDSEGDAEKPVKTPKTGTKLTIKAPKTPATAESSKKAKDTQKPGRAKGSAAKKSAAKASPSDDEETAETPKEPEKSLDPTEAKAKKEKEVLYLRHKLQKGFLSRDQAPKEEEMASMSTYIGKLEGYGDLEVSIIRTTKINKVLKAIMKLNTIPKDEEFNFRSRSVELLSKWNKLLGSEAPAAGPTGADKEDEPTTNGVHKDETGESEAEKSEKADASVAAAEAAPKDEENPEAPSEVKETNVDNMIDSAAPAAAAAEEAEKPAEEVKKDAEPPKPTEPVPEPPAGPEPSTAGIEATT